MRRVQCGHCTDWSEHCSTEQAFDKLGISAVELSEMALSKAAQPGSNIQKHVCLQGGECMKQVCSVCICELQVGCFISRRRYEAQGGTDIANHMFSRVLA